MKVTEHSRRDNTEDPTILKNLKTRFLLTQYGSMAGSLAAEVLFEHAAMSFSSLVMETADVGISKAVSYGCDPEEDTKSTFLKKFGTFFKMTQEKAAKAIRISAYVTHILAASVGMVEAYRLLGVNFETPGNLNLSITAVVAALNVWNYIDANKAENIFKGSQAMSLSGIRSMAQTNFAEMFGLVAGVLATSIGWSQAGNYAVMGSSLAVIGLMARQVLREREENPRAYSSLKV